MNHTFELYISNTLHAFVQLIYWLFEKDIDNADLVIWDHIDETRLTEWERNNIKQHIKKRLADGLSNIYVGINRDYKLSGIIGEDLKAYVQDNSTNIILFGKRGGLK